MTVTTNPGPTFYTSDGSTSTFGIGFPIFTAADLVVSVLDTASPANKTSLVSGIDYTVNLLSNQITLMVGAVATPKPAGYTIVLFRASPVVQNINFTNASGVFPANVTTVADYLTYVEQILDSRSRRAFRVRYENLNDFPADMVENASQRALKFLGFDASGNPIAASLVTSTANLISAYMQTVVAAANAGAARTLLGAPSNADGTLTSAAPSIRDTFTVSGTWTKRTGVKRVRIACWGAGGGAGGGAKTNSGTASSGGGGGGGGAYKEAWYDASGLGATETVTVGLGGTAGTGAAVVGAGANGGQGGDTTFGAHITANGGGPGSGGQSAGASGGGGGAGASGAGGAAAAGAGGAGGANGGGAGGSGAAGASTDNGITGAGGAGGVNTAAGVAGGNSLGGASGGGSGGGIDAAPTGKNGGTAGFVPGASTQPAAGTGGTAGTNGAGGATVEYGPGQGGAGGGSATAGANSGGVGGAGSAPGGGGGGGGSTIGGSGGNGGPGGAGLVIVDNFY